jgi:acetoin utilization protein AcuB
MEEAHTSKPVVRDVMTPNPAVVHPDDAVGTVRELFDRHGFHAVPVVDAQGDLVGLVTKQSFRRLARDRPGAPAPVAQIRDVMAHGTSFVEPADPLSAVVEEMTRKRVRSVPVIERAGGRLRLVGIVSRGNLLRGLTASRRA